MTVRGDRLRAGTGELIYYLNSNQHCKRKKIWNRSNIIVNTWHYDSMLHDIGFTDWDILNDEIRIMCSFIKVQMLLN